MITLKLVNRLLKLIDEIPSEFIIVSKRAHILQRHYSIVKSIVKTPEGELKVMLQFLDEEYRIMWQINITKIEDYQTFTKNIADASTY